MLSVRYSAPLNTATGAYKVAKYLTKKRPTNLLRPPAKIGGMMVADGHVCTAISGSLTTERHKVSTTDVFKASCKPILLSKT